MVENWGLLLPNSWWNNVKDKLTTVRLCKRLKVGKVILHKTAGKMFCLSRLENETCAAPAPKYDRKIVRYRVGLHKCLNVDIDLGCTRTKKTSSIRIKNGRHRNGLHDSQNVRQKAGWQKIKKYVDICLVCTRASQWTAPSDILENMDLTFSPTTSERLTNFSLRWLFKYYVYYNFSHAYKSVCYSDVRSLFIWQPGVTSEQNWTRHLFSVCYLQFPFWYNAAHPFLQKTHVLSL